MGKRWGQHFLKDKGIAHRIAALAELDAQSHVLEIGPGQGALTQALLATGAYVCAIERDPQLYQYLQSNWGHHPRLMLLQEDILHTNLQQLFQHAKPFDVVANLPYYITTPLLMRLIPLRSYFKRLVLTIQSEVAQRAVATTATPKQYGSLSVAVQSAFHPRICFKLPPAVFSPVPAVHSAVIMLTPKKKFTDTSSETAFFQWVKQLFSQRRKQLRNIAVIRQQPSYDLPPDWQNLRPENLNPQQLFALFQLLSPKTLFLDPHKHIMESKSPNKTPITT